MPPRRSSWPAALPLGELPKEKTRELAREFGLTVAEKADSQDICFVTQGRYSDVIERLAGAVQGGEIVHLDGRVLGRHEGIIHYTVGQRKGSASPWASRSMSFVSMPRRPAWWSAPGRPWPPA